MARSDGDKSAKKTPAKAKAPAHVQKKDAEAKPAPPPPAEDKAEKAGKAKASDGAAPAAPGKPGRPPKKAEPPPRKAAHDDDDGDDGDDSMEASPRSRDREEDAVPPPQPRPVAPPGKKPLRPGQGEDAPAVVPARRLTAEAKAAVNEMVKKGVPLGEALARAASWETFVAPPVDPNAPKPGAPGVRPEGAPKPRAAEPDDEDEDEEEAEEKEASEEPEAAADDEDAPPKPAAKRGRPKGSGKKAAGAAAPARRKRDDDDDIKDLAADDD